MEICEILIVVAIAFIKLPRIYGERKYDRGSW